MNWLYSVTGYSFFDYWAIAHFATWVAIANHVAKFTRNNELLLRLTRKQCFIIGVVLAYVWEIVEAFLAPANPDTWTDPESWWNAWVSDPLTCVVAFVLMYWVADHTKFQDKK